MNKSCFIITPIGGELSPVRRRVDQWMKLIYEPALGDEFKLVRADQISAPGIITEQILDQIVHADLALIDYTELNPNVMYEAAIRHISNKPFIQIYPNTIQLPFDISNLRAICYNPEDLQYPETLSKQIKDAYKDMQNENYKVPELLPLKFDLEKIVSDPVKFVEVLKQHFLLAPGNNNFIGSFSQPNITEVYDPVATLAGAMTNRVKCPKCGIIQTISFNHSATLTIGSKHYKCNNCGTEFE